MNERIFTSATRAGRSRRPAGSASSCELHRQPDQRVEQERGGKDGAPREVVAEKWRGYGDVHGRPQPLAGDVVDQREIRRRDTREAVGPCARSAERLEISAHRLRGIELLQGQHRSHAPAQFQDWRVSDTRPPSVGDGVRIAALDLHTEVDDLPRRRLPDDAHLPGQGSHRSPPEPGLGHGGPGGELSDRLRHEAGRERRKSRGDGEASPGPPAIVQRRDPIHEREGTETVRHR